MKNLLLPLNITTMQKNSFFIMSPGAGKTTPGEANKMRYTDGFGDVMTHLVERPDVISIFFNLY
jgi:hypothetical protein